MHHVCTHCLRQHMSCVVDRPYAQHEGLCAYVVNYKHCITHRKDLFKQYDQRHLKHAMMWMLTIICACYHLVHYRSIHMQGMHGNMTSGANNVCVSLKALPDAASRCGSGRGQVHTYVQSGLSNQIRAYNTSSCDIPIGARRFHSNGNCNQVTLMQILAASHHSCNAQ